MNSRQRDSSINFFQCGFRRQTKRSLLRLATFGLRSQDRSSLARRTSSALHLLGCKLTGISKRSFSTRLRGSVNSFYPFSLLSVLTFSSFTLFACSSSLGTVSSRSSESEMTITQSSSRLIVAGSLLGASARSFGAMKGGCPWGKGQEQLGGGQLALIQLFCCWKYIPGEKGQGGQGIACGGAGGGTRKGWLPGMLLHETKGLGCPWGPPCLFHHQFINLSQLLNAYLRFKLPLLIPPILAHNTSLFNPSNHQNKYSQGYPLSLKITKQNLANKCAFSLTLVSQESKQGRLLRLICRSDQRIIN